MTGDLPSSCQEVCQESREEGDALGSLNKAWTARNQEPAPTVAKGTPPGTGQRSCHHCQYQALVTYFEVDLGGEGRDGPHHPALLGTGQLANVIVSGRDLDPD